MPLILRPATLADIPALREMLVATWHATYDGTLGVEKVNEIAATWHSIEKLSAECALAQAEPEAHALLVAEQGGGLVGTVSAHFHAPDVFELARLYIAPDLQRGGIGRALLEAAVASLPKSKRARLEVEPRNSQAIAFYRKHGFSPVRQENACGGDQAAAIAHLVMEASMPLLRLRPAEDRDAQDLFGLLTLCFAEYPGCFTDPHGDLPDLVRPGHWCERRKAGRLLGGAFLVTEDETGRICACVAVDFPANEADGAPVAELHRLYVRPDQRGRGLAARLVGAVEEIARQEGARRMTLWSDTRFLDAHRLYTRLGYEQGPHRRALGDISSSEEYDFTKNL